MPTFHANKISMSTGGKFKTTRRQACERHRGFKTLHLFARHLAVHDTFEY
ncbi:hypothetical protein OH687_29715 [Burkholderia anthina]|nr:hypothetical protein OH687_29715 [Burkholderia anthina]